MTDSLIILTAWFLSGALSSFIFDKLNCKYDLFKEMQSKVNNLGEQRKKKLRFISFVLIVGILGIMIRFEVSKIIQGLVMGPLFIFRDLFFDSILIR